jgi:flagellar motor switch protein FliM
MKKILSQKEIDEMIRSARHSPEVTAPIVQPPAVTLWDGRLAGQIGQEHMQAINRLHEAFARNLSHSVGAYLRIEFQAALVSGEHLTYGEFLQSIPEVTYLASCKLTPADISILLQLDLAVALPIRAVPMAAPPIMTSSAGCMRTLRFRCSIRYPAMIAPKTTTIPMMANIVSTL